MPKEPKLKHDDEDADSTNSSLQTTMTFSSTQSEEVEEPEEPEEPDEESPIFQQPRFFRRENIFCPRVHPTISATLTGVPIGTATGIIYTVALKALKILSDPDQAAALYGSGVATGTGTAILVSIVAYYCCSHYPRDKNLHDLHKSRVSEMANVSREGEDFVDEEEEYSKGKLHKSRRDDDENDFHTLDDSETRRWL